MKFVIGYKLRLMGLGLPLFLAACDQPSSDELLDKTIGLTTPADVQSAIGPADRVSNMGTSEIWKYDTSSGEVCFIASGNAIVRFSCI